MTKITELVGKYINSYNYIPKIQMSSVWAC